MATSPPQSRTRSARRWVLRVVPALDQDVGEELADHGQRRVLLEDEDEADAPQGGHHAHAVALAHPPAGPRLEAPHAGVGSLTRPPGRRPGRGRAPASDVTGVQQVEAAVVNTTRRPRERKVGDAATACCRSTILRSVAGIGRAPPPRRDDGARPHLPPWPPPPGWRGSPLQHAGAGQTQDEVGEHGVPRPRESKTSRARVGSGGAVLPAECHPPLAARDEHGCGAAVRVDALHRGRKAPMSSTANPRPWPASCAWRDHGTAAIARESAALGSTTIASPGQARNRHHQRRVHHPLA